MLAEALRELQSAIGTEDWHAALPAAVIAWRSDRSPAVYQMLAKLAPTLKVLDLGAAWWHGGPFRTINDLSTARRVELLHLVRALFPALTQIRIEQSSVREEARPALAAIPGVQLVAGSFGF